MTKRYAVAFEVGSSFGMFARPDSGSEPCSYPIATPSACRGMIESICRIKGVDLTIVAIACCSMPRWTEYSFNSYSPFRKYEQKIKGSACQIRATVLENPRFQVLATASRSKYRLPPQQMSHLNGAHAFQSIFFRRLVREQNYHPVCLGWKEFQAEYIGIQKTPVETKFNTILPSFMVGCFDEQGNLHESGDFRQNVEIQKGIVNLTDDEVLISDDGLLCFADTGFQSQINYFVEGTYQNA